MGKETGISWCDSTANLWWGCTEVHEGCDRCYARTLARSKGKGSAWDGVRFATKAIWADLPRWQAQAAKSGQILRVFTGSMMDIFEKSRAASDWSGNPTGATTGDLRDRYFREVVPATPDLLHLLLTKRPGNIPKMVPPAWLKEWPVNVMTGTSVVNQGTADTLIDQLLEAPGRHFLSMEPLLSSVDLGRWLTKPHMVGRITEAHGGTWLRIPDTESGIDWIVVGGESGPGARPFDLAWARSIRDQCRSAGIPYFFKQAGSHPIGSYDERMRMIGQETTGTDAVVRWKLGSRHGSDLDELPVDLRIQQFPKAVPA